MTTIEDIIASTSSISPNDACDEIDRHIEHLKVQIDMLKYLRKRLGGSRQKKVVRSGGKILILSLRHEIAEAIRQRGGGKVSIETIAGDLGKSSEKIRQAAVRNQVFLGWDPSDRTVCLAGYPASSVGERSLQACSAETAAS